MRTGRAQRPRGFVMLQDASCSCASVTHVTCKLKILNCKYELTACVQ